MPSPTPPSPVAADLHALITDAGIPADDQTLVGRLVTTALGLGRDDSTRLDLKIAAAALEELRAAYALFAPYRHVPKVTIFGSARTGAQDPAYALARDTAAELARAGWMVVTGAGPGIMQAAAEGAGAESSLGVAIRLPFEEKPNPLITGSARSVTMKYFFTRKLMLVKESRGFACLPGGFGTLDELFELLTLQQTGKTDPTPIVLMDVPGGTFWSGLDHFVTGTLEPAGMISPGDLDRVTVADSSTAAVESITAFWRNYDSLRWVGDKLVLRLRHEPTTAEVDRLNDEFASLLSRGRITASGPLKREQADHDRLELPRLVLRLNPHRVGSLYRLIGAINDLPSGRAR